MLLLVLLVSGAARAGDVADEADFFFRRGEAFIEQRRYEDALAALYQANDLAPDNAATRLNIALCLEGLKRFDEAFRVQADLANRPLPRPLTPAQRRKVEDAIARLKPRLALLTVDSTPRGAAIFLGRKDLGSLGATPKTLAVPRGDTVVILDLPGYKEGQRRVRADIGKEQKVDVVLERIEGTVELDGIPPNAQVHEESAAGTVLRTGPGSARLPAGRTHVYVTAPGFVPARVDLDVEMDRTTSVRVTLAPAPIPTGTLIVRANMDGALVRVDGNDMGFTPAVLERVPAGTRTVEVIKEGRETETRKVDLAEGGRVTLDVKLRMARAEISGVSRETLRIEDAPASVTVITAEEIRAFGYRTLGEALRSVRGFYVWDDRTHMAAGVRGISEPGTDGTAVLVMLDGHPLNDGILGRGPVGFELPIDLADVERIEVVRGGGIAFGVVALAGVVNVVTRRPRSGLDADVGADVGTLDVIDGHVLVGTKRRFGDISLYAGGDDRTGQTLPGAALNADREQAMHAGLVAHFGETTVIAGWGQRLKALPSSPYGSLPDGHTSVLDQHGFVEAQFEHAYPGGSHLYVRGGFDQENAVAQYDFFDGTTQDRATSFTGSAEMRWDWAALSGLHVPVLPDLRLVTDLALRAGGVQQPVVEPAGTPEAYWIGPDGSHESTDQGTPDGEVSAYVGLDYIPSSRLHVTLGYRQFLNGVVSPGAAANETVGAFQCVATARCTGDHLEFAVVGKPYEGGTTKVLASQVTRAISAREAFHADNQRLDVAPPASLVNQGPTAGPAYATDLSGDRLLLIELEHTHRFTDELTGAASAFFLRHQDVVVRNVDPVSGLLQYGNAGWVNGFGADAELRYEPGDGTWVSATYGHYRYVREAGRPPPVNAPTDLGSFRALFPVSLPLVRVGAEAVLVAGRLGVDGQPVPDSFLVNVLVSGEHAQTRLRYTLGLYNALDNRAGDPTGWEIPTRTITPYGRSVRLDLAWRY